MDRARFAADGFAILPRLLDPDACDAVEARLAGVEPGQAGTRCLLDRDWCRALAADLRRHPAVAALLPDGLAAVQCTLFEKSAGRNWLVPIHQDLSIPVADRVDRPELRGWSEKEGTLYVQPPVEVLEQLTAVRLHVDDCGAADGPLRVVPGSHRAGRVDPEAAARARRASGEVVCAVPRGGGLLMRPLLLHASSRAGGNGRRRVLHFLFGPRTLPLNLRWPAAV